MSERDHLLSQLDRLCASEALHGSDSLCRLLRYLAQKEIDTPGVHIKEYQIATEVYGRPADFDPQSDSAVRVQAARLRGKLADYYASAGAHDPITVDIPKGSYSLHFRHRINGRPARDPARSARDRLRFLAVTASSRSRISCSWAWAWGWMVRAASISRAT